MTPYETNTQLPDTVKEYLPKHAQDIYREAFNHAHEEYQDPNKRHDPHESLETVCHRVAWRAVKQTYTKNTQDKWVKKTN